MHILLVTIFLCLTVATSAHSADRLRIAYSSISAAYLGIWTAKDAGFFAKEGLDDQLVFIPSATQLAQVLVGRPRVGSTWMAKGLGRIRQGTLGESHGGFNPRFGHETLENGFPC